MEKSEKIKLNVRLIDNEFNNFIKKMNDNMDITNFHLLEINLKEIVRKKGFYLIDVYFLVCIRGFIFIIEKINKNVIGNPNYSNEEINDFLLKFIPMIDKFHKSFIELKEKSEITKELVFMQNFVQYWLRSNKRELNMDNLGIIEKICCKNSEENQKKKKKLILLYKKYVEKIIDEMKLNKNDVLLVFVSKRVGCIGTILLLPDLVNETGINATELNMCLDTHANCFGMITTNKKCILIYDKDMTSNEIDEIEKVLSLQGAKLCGIILLNKERYNHKRNDVMLCEIGDF